MEYRLSRLNVYLNIMPKIELPARCTLDPNGVLYLTLALTLSLKSEITYMSQINGISFRLNVSLHEHCV